MTTRSPITAVCRQDNPCSYDAAIQKTWSSANQWHSHSFSDWISVNVTRKNIASHRSVVSACVALQNRQLRCLRNCWTLNTPERNKQGKCQLADLRMLLRKCSWFILCARVMRAKKLPFHAYQDGLWFLTYIAVVCSIFSDVVHLQTELLSSRGIRGVKV